MPRLISPLIITLAVALYGLVHSWLASHHVKTQVQSRFGEKVGRTYRLVYNIFATLSFLPILALTAALPDMGIYRIPYPWVLITTAFQILAVLLLSVGLWQTGLWSFLGLQQLLERPDVISQKFVVTGLYRWVRHPLYTAGLLFIWLTPVMTSNILALIASLSAYLIVGAYIEERKLVAEFREAYLEYQDRTPMLFPIRISRFTSSG